MIERDFVAQKTKEYYIKKYIENRLKGVGISLIKLKKIPLGEKIIIYTSKPSLIVGSKGSNIRDITKALKKDFNLENPQIEINEVKDIFIDAAIVADRIAGSLERFGSARFKGIAHKIMENVMNSGARGIEIVISGKIPGARAKSWRFYQGYLKKCGDVAVEGVRKAHSMALLKTGVVGVKVAIMPPDLILPDTINVFLSQTEAADVVPPVSEKSAEPPLKAEAKKKSNHSKDESKREGKETPKRQRKTTTKKIVTEKAADKKEGDSPMTEGGAA